MSISTDSTRAAQKKQEPAGHQSRNLQGNQTVRDELYVEMWREKKNEQGGAAKFRKSVKKKKKKSVRSFKNYLSLIKLLFYKFNKFYLETFG